MMPTSDPGQNLGSAPLPAIIPPHHAGFPAVPVAAMTPAMKVDPIALLKALRRRWLLALGAGLVCAGIVGAVAYVMVPPAKYTARAMLHVNSVPPRLIFRTGEVFPDFQAYQRTQLALMKSRLVLSEALKRNEGEAAKLPLVARQADPIEWLEKELQVDFANGSEILRISMSGDEARVPMILVNAAVEAYLGEIVDVETKQRRDRYELLTKTWDEYQRNMSEKRKELKRLMELAGSDDKRTLANLQQHGLDRLGRAEDELARVQSELRGLKVELEVLRQVSEQSASGITATMIEDELANDPSIEKLNERVAQAKTGIDRTSRLVRSPSDPALQKHRKDFELAQAALNAQRRRLYPIIEQQLRERARGDLGTKGAPLEMRAKILSGLEQTLADEVKRLTVRSETISRTSVDLFSVQEEIANAELVSKTIGGELEALKLELKAPPRIRLLEKAEQPRTKDETRPLKMAGLAGFGAFALVLAGVSFWEFRSQRIDSADELVRHLGMKLVGTLPALPSPNRLLGASEDQNLRWKSLLIESVDAARTALLHISRTESFRVVMVASALGGEGKTSLSGHLATSLARAGRRTLLIDGDLRRPSAHQLFDLPLEPGLCEVLRGEVQPDDVVQPTMVEGVWLVPAGRMDNRAIQALAYKDLRSIFARFKEQFDFIVVDSSPVLPVADALLIGQHVDAVLFSIMRDVSRLPKVQAAYDRIASLGIPMLGGIVTGAPGDLYGSQYHYYNSPRSSTSA